LRFPVFDLPIARMKREPILKFVPLDEARGDSIRQIDRLIASRGRYRDPSLGPEFDRVKNDQRKERRLAVALWDDKPELSEKRQPGCVSGEQILQEKRLMWLKTEELALFQPEFARPGPKVLYGERRRQRDLPWPARAWPSPPSGHFLGLLTLATS